MENLKSKVCICFDHGSHVAFAQRLSREFGTVYYFNPTAKSAYPSEHDAAVGEGMEGITVIYDFYDYIDEADLIVFFDLYHDDLQQHLVRIGKRVWGAREGEEIETERIETKKLMRRLGLPVNPYKVVTGLDNLREYLKENEDVFVKVSRWRGDGETFHSENYQAIKNKLDQMQVFYGAMAGKKEFCVEKPIKAVCEAGLDLYSIDGQYPEIVPFGFEIKDCYDDQTEVLTNTGWKLFKDLLNSDEVFTLDISDKRHYKTEFQKSEKYIEQEYVGPMLAIKAQGVDLVVTPNHKLLVQVNSQNKETGKVVKMKRWTGAAFDGENVFYTGKRERKLIAVKDLDLSKPFYMPHPTSPIYKSNCGSSSDILIGSTKFKKKQLATLLGLYLSEGSVAHTRITHNYISISQFKHVDKMTKLLSGLPIKFTRIKSGFGASDKDLCDYLRQFGKSADKFIPQWLKESSKEVLNAFLYAYCLGDGSFRITDKEFRSNKRERLTTVKTYYTKSKRMADDLQEIMIKCGKLAGVSRHKNRNIYTVAERGPLTKNIIFPKHHHWINYSGKIYCVTVPNHIIMVRRNGLPIWSGNSGYACTIKPYKDISPLLTDFTDKISDTLRELQYRSDLSTECRITDKKVSFCIDIVAGRKPSPPSEVLQELISNWGEIMYFGAEGKMIEPEYEAEFGMEVIIHCECAKKDWVTIQVPEEIRRWTKLKNVCIVDDAYQYIPQAFEMEEIGAVVSIGKSLEECEQKIKEYCGMIVGHGLEMNTESIIEKLHEQIDSAAKVGIKF